MEVIAKKAYRMDLDLWFMGFFSVLFGVFFIMQALAIYLCVVKEEVNGIISGFIFAPIFLIIFLVFGIELVSYQKTPKEIFTYDGEYIICSKGSFLPSKIDYVVIKPAKGRYGELSWGKITLWVGSKVITYNYIERVKKVYNRLMALKRQVENGEERA